MLKPLLVAGLALGMISAASAAPKRLDLSKPEDAVTAFRKVQCSAKDGESVVYHWVGEVYSRVEGEPDKHLFDLQGMNIRQCVTVNDPVRGKGVRVTCVLPGSTDSEFQAANGTADAMSAMPNWLIASPEQVVAAALNANDRGKLVVIPGWYNQLAALLFRLAPDSWQRWAAHRAATTFGAS
jgi:hypothetical protein